MSGTPAIPRFGESGWGWADQLVEARSVRCETPSKVASAQLLLIGARPHPGGGWESDYFAGNAVARMRLIRSIWSWSRIVDPLTNFLIKAFDGPVPARRVLAIVERLKAVPADEICLADTIRVGVPARVRELVCGARTLGATVGAHFHNTSNTGHTNALAALEEGVASLDASVGGVGGCPLAPDATGKIATEDLVYLRRRRGLETGIDLDALIEASRWLGTQLGKELPGMLARAGDYPLANA